MRAQAETTWRDRKRTELSDLLYRTALDAIRRDGFENCSVEQITRAAGVSKGTFFNYFPSKQHVVARFYREVTAEALMGIRAKADESARQRIDRLFRRLCRAALKEPRVFSAVARNLEHEPLRGEGKELDLELLIFCEAQIRRDQERGLVDSELAADRFATLLIESLTAAANAWDRSEHGTNLLAEVRWRCELLWRIARPC